MPTRGRTARTSPSAVRGVLRKIFCHSRARLWRDGCRQKRRRHMDAVARFEGVAGPDDNQAQLLDRILVF